VTIDALSLAAICNEANELIRGCRIQKIMLTGALSLVIEVYNPEYHRRVQFLLSADAQNARFHLLSQKASQMPGDPTGLLLVLKRYLRYGIITDIFQAPFERIVTLTIAKKFPLGKRPQFAQKGGGSRPEAEVVEDDYEETDDEEYTGTEAQDAEIYESRIVIEMMGRHSNVMLLSEDSLIIDAIKRVASGRNRYRIILPHQPYVLPPPQEKRPFHLESPVSFARAMEEFRNEKPTGALWQTLVTTFSGVSPQLGREIAYRLGEKEGHLSANALTLAEVQSWDLLYREVKGLVRPLAPDFDWEEAVLEPTVVRDEDGQIVAFAPYELRQFRPDGLEPEKVETTSLAAEEFYSQTESIGGQSQRKEQIAGILNEHLEKERRRATALEESLKRAESAEVLRRKGEAIYANLYEITPGLTQLVADGLKITLDPDLTPSENAQAYFREYDKSRKALAGVPELVAEAKLEIEYLDEMLTQLNLAESFDEVANIKAELDEAGYGSRPKESEKAKPKAKAKKRRLPQTPTYTSSDGFTIYVGKSAQHNDYVTFQIGDKLDLWLHARGMPGSHVIIKTGGREVPENTLLEAAALAGYYSKGQTSTRVEVTYVPQRFVRKVKGPHPGLVTISNDKSVNVKPKKLTTQKPGTRG
jgi:predicted ribosome quality control (RQC) complex YloA/Tae2 family protein